MGCRKLIYILRSKYITVRECAEQTNVDLNRLYGPEESLTEEEKDIVYKWLTKKNLTKLTREEVFENNVDNQYEFDTVYKSEAIARSRRRSAHKR